jgi:hypothetical protein
LTVNRAITVAGALIRTETMRVAESGFRLHLADPPLRSAARAAPAACDFVAGQMRETPRDRNRRERTHAASTHSRIARERDNWQLRQHDCSITGTLENI